jgi:hypothetical protein
MTFIGIWDSTNNELICIRFLRTMMSRKSRSRVTVDDLTELSQMLRKRSTSLQPACVIGEIIDSGWRVAAAYVDAMRFREAMDRLLNELSREVTAIDIHAQ